MFAYNDISYMVSFEVFFDLASQVRLTTSPYEGYIQVYDGSIWRYVGENNWDKSRQKMFCEYLGFNSTDASISRAYLNRQNNIATGEFICYKTQSEKISCCVHLKPTIKESTWIPYARCKNTYVRDSQIAFAANILYADIFLLIGDYVRVYVGLHS